METSKYTEPSDISRGLIRIEKDMSNEAILWSQTLFQKQELEFELLREIYGKVQKQYEEKSKGDWIALVNGKMLDVYQRSQYACVRVCKEASILATKEQIPCYLVFQIGVPREVIDPNDALLSL